MAGQMKERFFQGVEGGWVTFSNNSGSDIIVRLDQVKSFELRPGGSYDALATHDGKIVRLGYITTDQMKDLRAKADEYMKVTARH